MRVVGQIYLKTKPHLNHQHNRNIMATYDFRILLETVGGGKTSYYSSSFVDTSVDMVLSASQVFDRITGSLSCSYQNTTFFSQSTEPTTNDINTSFVF